MYALESEPEKGGRLKRLGGGAVLAVVIGTSVIVAAQHVAPNSKLFQSVMKIAIVDYTPPKPRPRDADTPPPPEPEKAPPKPKERAPQAPKAAAPVPANQPQKPQSEAPDIGLDSTSFGSGSGGPAFAMGTSQMGTPVGAGGSGTGATAIAPVDNNKPAPKMVEARARPGNRVPPYPDRARRKAIEGLMVVEADIDPQGRVTRAVVRNKLEESLDEEARKAVLGWTFEPATLLGKAVPSTKFLRIRFQLQ